MTNYFDTPDTTDMALDEHGNYPGQSEHELSEYLKTDEAQLSGYTTEQLQDEIYRRLFEPLNTALRKLNDTIDNLTPPF